MGKQRIVYTVTERPTPEGPRSYWTKVGVAVENRDASISVRLDALPLSGTLQLREDDRDRAAVAGLPPPDRALQIEEALRDIAQRGPQGVWTAEACAEWARKALAGG